MNAGPRPIAHGRRAIAPVRVGVGLPRGVITSGLKVHGGVAGPAEGGECGS